MRHYIIIFINMVVLMASVDPNITVLYQLVPPVVCYISFVTGLTCDLSYSCLAIQAIYIFLDVAGLILA